MIAPKMITGAFAPHRGADTILAALGISAALVSSTFAAYMILVGPQGGGRRGHVSNVTVPAPIHQTEAGNLLPTTMAGGESIDFTPTGSIPIAGDQPIGREAQTGQSAILRDFAVRDVFDGTALVEASGVLHMVSSGDTLDGAGKVLAIERKGRGWIVRTAGGIIPQRR